MKDKTFFWWQVFIIIAMIGMALVLGACTEEIIIEKEKIVEVPAKPDTTTHQSGPPPVFSHADTTKCQVVMPDSTTCPACEPQVIVEIDSVFITQTITETVYVDRIEYDTVDHYIHVYTDTLVWVSYMRNTWSVPSEIMPFVEDFGGEAWARGIQTPGGPLIVSYVPESELPGEGWNSTSYWFGGQQIILLNGEINPDHLYTPMLREQAKLQLNRKYNTRADDLMNPTFDPARVTINSPEKKVYLDKLFNVNPI